MPIVTALACIVAGVVAEPRLAADRAGDRRLLALGGGRATRGVAFALYGVVERSLLPFGLHHIWNVPFFFEVGAVPRPGDRQR